MAAYVVVRVEIRDPDRFDRYREAVAPNVAAFGGRYLVRGGPMELLEGDDDGRRIVILEFESLAHVRKWWNSPEYAEIRELREGAAILDVVAVGGA